VNSRYALESRRSKDMDFNDMKDCNRPIAELREVAKMNRWQSTGSVL